MPEARRSSISGVTIRELLTHTSGIPLIDTGWPHSTWSESFDRICRVNSLVPGSAYQPQSTWFLLGEILQRLDADHRPFRSILTEDVLVPMGIDEAWCGLAESQVAGLVDRLPQFSVSERGEISTSEFSSKPWLTQPSPGGNFCGPVRQLGRFYEMLLHNGRTSFGEAVLSPETVANMTSAHRTDRFDDTMQHIVDLGLGLFLDSNRHGQKSVPYGFGKYCSPETFGHGGAQCAMGFCDPVHKLVVAWAANGFCSEPQHQRRNRGMNEAIYEDLDLFS
ncbi:MAG: serine hydrolase domain-containing protein [Fuerstiella sp.]